MKTIFYLTFAACLLTGVLACSLKDIFKIKEELPTLSQDGRKAMGFLLNGDVWIPKGSHSSPRYNFDVDPGFSDGIFGASAYRYPKDGNTRDGLQSFKIGSDSIKSVGLYPIKKGTRQEFRFFDYDSNCEYFNTDSTCQYDGYLKITMYDLDKGKFQGEFELKVSKPGCETLNITKGRFAWQF